MPKSHMGALLGGLVATLFLACMAMLMRTDVVIVGLEQDRLDAAAARLAQTLEAGRRPLQRMAPLKRPAAFQAPDLVHQGYPLEGGSGFSAVDHVIAQGRANSPIYSAETDVLNGEVEKSFGVQQKAQPARGIQWRFSPPAAVGSDVPSANAAAMRNTMEAVQRMNANRPVAREYTSWVQRQRQGAGRNSKPSGVKPSLHWMDYVLPTAAPQDPMRHLGKDAAPYAHYVDVDRKFNDAFLRHRDAQAAMAERVKQLQGQHGDDAPTDEVSKVTFRRTVRDMGNTAPPSGGRDAVLDADANSELESSISARVDRVRQEADAIAFAVKEGVKEGVREVEKGMAGQEEKMGEGMRREVDQMVTSAVEPWVKQADEERSVVVEQGKLIADMRGRIAKMEAHAPSAAGPAAAPSADYVTEAVSAAVKAAVSAATATSASPSSAAPPAVSFSLPGQVSLPGGAYTFSLGSPGAAAPSSFIQPVQYADTSPPLTAEPPVASASGDDDDLLDTMRDLDNGVDAAKVKEAADQLMRRLVAQGAPAPAGGAQEEDSGVLDTRTGTSSGVDMDAVRRAADELQRRLIARLAGGDAAGDSDVLDTRTDTSAGVDASAVGAAAAALEKRMVGRQGPSDVLDSVVGTSAGVDRDAVVSAADALQRSLIAKGSGAPPDVLDSVVGTSAGVDSAGVDAAADALQRNIITGESAARASGGKGRGDDVLNSVMDLDNGVDVQAVKEAAMRLQREVASRLDHSGKGVA